MGDRITRWLNSTFHASRLHKDPRSLEAKLCVQKGHDPMPVRGRLDRGCDPTTLSCVGRVVDFPQKSLIRHTQYFVSLQRPTLLAQSSNGFPRIWGERLCQFTPKYCRSMVAISRGVAKARWLGC